MSWLKVAALARKKTNRGWENKDDKKPEVGKHGANSCHTKDWKVLDPEKKYH